MYAYSVGYAPYHNNVFFCSELEMLGHIFSRQLWKLATLSQFTMCLNEQFILYEVIYFTLFRDYKVVF